MSETPTASLEKVSRRMSDVLTEMHEITRLAGYDGSSGKDRIALAARRLKLEWRRAKTFYYAEPARVDAHEADRLRAWRRQHEALEMARLERRLNELRARHEALGEKLHGGVLDGDGRAVLADE